MQKALLAVGVATAPAAIPRRRGPRPQRIGLVRSDACACRTCHGRRGYPVATACRCEQSTANRFACGEITFS